MYKFYGTKENEEPETVDYWFCDVRELVLCEIIFYVESLEGDYSELEAYKLQNGDIGWVIVTGRDHSKGSWHGYIMIFL